MTEQLVLDYTERHAAQQANLAAATAVNRPYREAAERVLAELIRAGEPFTADDIRQRLDGIEPHSPNVLPSMLGIWAARRHIVPCGEYRSRRRSRRASRNRVWIGRSCPSTSTTD